MRIFLNDIYPVKKYVLQISVGYKRKEDSSQVMEAVGSFYGVGYGILADAGDVGLHVITFFFGEQFYRLQDFFTETETWYLSFRPDIPAEVEKLKQTLTDENTDNRFSQASSE